MHKPAIFALLPALLCAQIGLAQDTDDEKFFKKLRDRLVGMPKSADDALKTFDPRFEKTLACPENSPDLRATLVVTSRVKPWDEKRATEDTHGLYTIAKPKTEESIDQQTRRTVKTVTFSNELRLNRTGLDKREDTNAGKVANEIVLYHELLHAELFVERAIKEFEKQLAEICKSKQFKVSENLGGDTDAEHKTIDPLEDKYGDNNETRGIIYERIEIAANTRTAFDSVKLKKDLKLGGRVTCWGSENVTKLAVEADPDGDELFYTATITDKEKATIKCVVDPPELVLAVVLAIPPASFFVEIPTLSRAAILLLATLILLAGWIVLLHRSP